MDRWFYLGFSVHFPTDVDLQTGIRRIWSWHCPPQMFLNKSLHNRRNSVIFEKISSYLGENIQIACSSGPSNQAATKKHHQSIIIHSQSSLDLIKSLSQSRSSLYKQRRLIIFVAAVFCRITVDTIIAHSMSSSRPR